ncbi:hypothetical protein HYY72_02175 [Candidatus Woesearchaeota archaeon]|nr:hypothetical protein [Candidatus Woesearchaeota archaeon]
MAFIHRGVGVCDELNLYLVAEGLKPAAIVSVAKGYSVRSVKQGSIVGVYADTPDLGVGDFLLRQLMADSQFALVLGRDYHHFSGAKDFYVGFNGALERLASAKTDEERGLALGFPEPAVRAYSAAVVVDGEVRDGSFLQRRLWSALIEGVELPSWLAYISFVPEELDIVHGQVSRQSRMLGERYKPER